MTCSCITDEVFGTMVAIVNRSHGGQPAFVLLARSPVVFPIQPFPNAHAAAFLLNPSTAVTALHAVCLESPPKVAGQRTTLLRSCIHADLAILSLSHSLSYKYPVTARAQPSSTRYTIRSPYARPVEASLVGIQMALIAYSGAFVPALTLKSKIPIPRGWSGSPVVDEFSRVVAMIIQSRGIQCHAIPCQIITYVSNHKRANADIGYIKTSEFEKRLEEDDGLRCINGYDVSEDGCIDWGMPAPLQAAVFDAADETVEAVITRSGMDQVVKLEVSTAGQAVALGGRRGVCVEAGQYVMEAVSVELLEMRYGARWGSAKLVDEVLCEGDEVVVFVRDAGEGLLFQKVKSVDGRTVSGLGDVIDGGTVQVGSRIVCVGRGKVRPCFVMEW